MQKKGDSTLSQRARANPENLIKVPENMIIYDP